MKIAIIAQHDGVKAGAGKHMQAYMDELYKQRDRFLADGTVESWTDFGGLEGAGAVTVLTLEQEKVAPMLADPQWSAQLVKSEFLFENFRWATYSLMDDAPEMRQMWIDLAAAYA